VVAAGGTPASYLVAPSLTGGRPLAARGRRSRQQVIDSPGWIWVGLLGFLGGGGFSSLPLLVIVRSDRPRDPENVELSPACTVPELGGSFVSLSPVMFFCFASFRSVQVRSESGRLQSPGDFGPRLYIYIWPARSGTSSLHSGRDGSRFEHGVSPGDHRHLAVQPPHALLPVHQR
jgi:hypothetical protein